jgi:hypothetical protein
MGEKKNQWSPAPRSQEINTVERKKKKKNINQHPILAPSPGRSTQWKGKRLSISGEIIKSKPAPEYRR